MRVKHPIRVIYGDTDQMGVVYYANYLRYFEAARGAYLREHGGSYRDWEDQGFALPVVEAHVVYRRPARYDDLIEVKLWVDEVRGASFKFLYEVTRGEDLLAEGWTVHACCDAKGRPMRMPPEMRRLLGVSDGV
jgi:acyl-CoA thioester hydrolase